nr:alkaline phosphatase D family protein [Actinomycetota bacterium]
LYKGDPDLQAAHSIAPWLVVWDDSAGQQAKPAVAADPDGPGFAVVFEDIQGTAASTVRVSGVASITSKTYEAQAHATGGVHGAPDVAMGAAQNAIVVWTEDGAGTGLSQIARKVLTPAGGLKLAQGTVNVSGDGRQRDPVVAANLNGDFAVAWETDHTGTAQVGVRSFSATGVAQSPVDTVLPGADPQIGVDDQRSVVVKQVARCCVCNSRESPVNVENLVGLDPVTTPGPTRRGLNKYAPGAHLRHSDPRTAPGPDHRLAPAVAGRRPYRDDPAVRVRDERLGDRRTAAV